MSSASVKREGTLKIIHYPPDEDKTPHKDRMVPDFYSHMIKVPRSIVINDIDRSNCPHYPEFSWLSDRRNYLQTIVFMYYFMPAIHN
jgi:hypothetical protein